MKLNIHLLLCSKRHYIDEIEHPPSPICGEKPQFESNVTSFQFRQNASARWWPLATTSPRRFGGDNFAMDYYFNLADTILTILIHKPADRPIYEALIL